MKLRQSKVKFNKFQNGQKKKKKLIIKFLLFNSKKINFFFYFKGFNELPVRNYKYSEKELE